MQIEEKQIEIRDVKIVDAKDFVYQEKLGKGA